MTKGISVKGDSLFCLCEIPDFEKLMMQIIGILITFQIQTYSL